MSEERFDGVRSVPSIATDAAGGEAGMINKRSGVCSCECAVHQNERDRLKAELEETKKRENTVRDISGNRLDLWLKAEKNYYLMAGKLAEALSWISEEYERGERKGYDMKVTPQMNGLAKEALSEFEGMK